MRGVDYLQSYGNFDSDVLDAVERSAYRQASVSWPEYKSRYNIPGTVVFDPKHTNAVEVFDIIPDDYDQTIVYHQPIGCILDSNRQIHAATLQAALPNTRVIAFGNPGQPGHGYGKVPLKDLAKVSNGDFAPVVAGALEYLEGQKIEESIHAGESYGADKATAAAANAANYDHNVTNVITVEPVSVALRGVAQMAITFLKTGAKADKYLRPVRKLSPTFLSAETLRESPATYALGLARLSNLAVTVALGKPVFESRATQAMVNNPDLGLGIAWGTASEFDQEDEREKIVSNLKTAFGSERVTGLPLENQTHAMNLDPFLNSAIIAQLLKNLGA